MNDMKKTQLMLLVDALFTLCEENRSDLPESLLEAVNTVQAITDSLTVDDLSNDDYVTLISELKGRLGLP